MLHNNILCDSRKIESPLPCRKLRSELQCKVAFNDNVSVTLMFTTAQLTGPGSSRQTEM